MEVVDVWAWLSAWAGTISAGDEREAGKKNRLLVADRVWSTWDPTSKSWQRFSLKVPIRGDRRDATGQFNSAD